MKIVLVDGGFSGSNSILKPVKWVWDKALTSPAPLNSPSRFHK